MNVPLQIHLSATYILTGTVIEMPTSVVVFGRIINVQTSEVESASQVIIRKSPEISQLMGSDVSPANRNER